MRSVILFTLLLLLTTNLSAKNSKDKEKKKQQQKSSMAAEHDNKHLSVSATLFNDRERQVLKDYRSETQDKKKKQKKLPKGLQKKLDRGGSLPPGWQKKLKTGSVIDRDTYRHARPLPDSVVARLPMGPSGTVIVEIEGEIVRLAEATLTIIDILKHH